MKKVYIVAIAIFLLLLLFMAVSVFTDGLPEEEWDQIEEDIKEERETPKEGWVYGRIQYIHDIEKPNEYFMELKDYPVSVGDGVPDVIGGYVETNVYVHVRLRGVDVARGLQEASTRKRPHNWTHMERYRWNQQMEYVWHAQQPHRTFRLSNIEINEPDKLLEADIEFYLGGQWHNLAIAMQEDQRARPLGHDWDWGTELGSLVNPNVPK